MGQSMAKIAGEFPAYRFVFSDLPEADITDEGAMRRLVEVSRAQAIVNCAAYTAVDRAETEPHVAEAVNTHGPRILSAIAGERGIPLVHISTDYVFDGRGSAPLREDDATGPLNVYGRTKLDGERAVMASGANALIIRTSWLYSEFGSNFVKTMLRLSETRSEIDVVDDQVGSPTYAEDLARAVMTLLGKGMGKYIDMGKERICNGAKLYHFSNRGEISRAGFAAEIFRLAGRQVRVNSVATLQYPTPAVRPLWTALDTSRIEAAGVAVPDWRESLSRCISELAHQEMTEKTPEKTP